MRCPIHDQKLPGSALRIRMIENCSVDATTASRSYQLSAVSYQLPHALSQRVRSGASRAIRAARRVSSKNLPQAHERSSCQLTADS